MNWRVFLFIAGYHVALLIGLPFYFALHPPGGALIAISVALLVLTEIGIGGAYHRFYSHRCYSLSRPAESLMLFLATLATQGSVLRWAYEHRLHHAYVDTDADPHSINKGFWYAHVLWLFHNDKPIDDSRVEDLLANPLVRFQHRYIGPLMIGSNLAVALLIGWALNDILGAIVLAWWTRMAVSHHLTWFVNSLAHTWGAQTYSKEETAVDNYMLAFFTVGEGYHNFHHTFPGDYRNGHRWYHFDPTKWTVWLFSKLGMADNLRRVSDVGIRKRLLIEDRRLLRERLAEQAEATRQEMRQRVENLAETILQKLKRQGTLAAHLKRASSDSRREMRRELKQLRHDLRRDWRAWHRLCGAVLAPQPA